MEKLKIHNFLVIKKADFDVGKINLIIGSQASGKSVIAKLLYFFKEFVNSTFLGSVQNFQTKALLQKKAIFDFEQYFPKYTWSGQEFTIIYKINDSEVSLTKEKGSSLKLDYSKNLASLHLELKKHYKKEVENKSSDEIQEGLSSSQDPFWNLIDKLIYKTDFADSFNSSLFIPASRSFFANFQKNIFSFLADNIDIDPFISTFGARYELAKRQYKNSQATLSITDFKTRIKFNTLVESILVGQYQFDDDQDWIESNSRKINIFNSSSGQQEALPMLVILSVWPFLSFRKSRKHTFFIEEPEAHLFPVSQKHIMSLISLIYKKTEHDFVITTHSPYILTAINNMVFANDVAKEKGYEAISDIIEEDYLIDFNDVKAYTIINGELINIVDEEVRLIGANVIDSVSDDFDYVFDSLIEKQMEKK